MIIDDEPVIVEGLAKVVEWGRYHCVLAGTAEDGETGIRVIRKERPDIIITDISMPRMDGLTMIAALKSEFPEMEICILTGYRDFDYAQKAITLGVSRFILKPSSMEQIDEALQAMTKKLAQGSLLRGLHVEKSEKQPKEEEKLLEEEGASSFIVKNAVNYMEENYARHLTLSEVAEQIYVSQWHLSKLLNKYKKKAFPIS